MLDKMERGILWVKRKSISAIKEGKGVNDIIVNTWEERSVLVLGYNSVYKSFATEEQAKEYLGIVDVKKVKKQAEKGIKHNKIRKETTRSISLRISKQMYDDFENKCEVFGKEKEDVIKDMIEEWIY